MIVFQRVDEDKQRCDFRLEIVEPERRRRAEQAGLEALHERFKPRLRDGQVIRGLAVVAHDPHVGECNLLFGGRLQVPHERHEALNPAFVAAADLDAGIGDVFLLRLEQDALDGQVRVRLALTGFGVDVAE